MTTDLDSKFRVVSVGDLVMDYYYKNGKLLGVNGGMTSHNIVLGSILSFLFNNFIKWHNFF